MQLLKILNDSLSALQSTYFSENNSVNARNRTWFALVYVAYNLDVKGLKIDSVKTRVHGKCIKRPIEIDVRMVKPGLKSRFVNSSRREYSCDKSPTHNGKIIKTEIKFIEYIMDISLCYVLTCGLNRLFFK